MKSLCAISSIRYASGTLVDVSSIVDLPGFDSSMQPVMYSGYDTYAQSNLSPTQLAGRSVSLSLEAAKLSPNQIDAVFYATNSIWNREDCSTDRLHSMLREVGIRSASLFGVFLSGCSNATDAILLASNLVSSGAYRSILVITSDCAMPASAVARVPVGRYAVMGDAAVCCVLTRSGCGEYDVLAANSTIDTDLAGVKIGGARYAVNSTVGMRRAINGVLDAAKIDRGDVSRVLMSNLREDYCITNIKALGFDVAKWYPGVRSRMGHCFAGDTLLNLQDLQDSGQLREGEHILLYSQSIAGWGGLLVRYNPDPPAISN